MNPDLLLQLAIGRMPRMRPRDRILLGETVDGAERFRSLGIPQIEEILRRRLPDFRFEPESLLRQAEKDLQILDRRGIGTVGLWERGYPPLLREIWDPPFLLFFRGSLPGQDVPAVSVVGTRNPDRTGDRAAFRLGVELGRLGLPVISGLALGIDGSAHKGALAGSGYTAAVLGSGIDAVYPRQHLRLGMRILEAGGGILSEYPPGTEAAKFRFPARNRIISGIARGAVIVQAPERSGALHTADFALEQGRDIFVHKEGLSGTAGAGTLRLSEMGAPEISGADDILRAWGYRPAGRSVSHSEALPDEEGNSERNTGSTLARLLESELSGNLIHYKGESFRSN